MERAKSQVSSINSELQTVIQHYQSQVGGRVEMNNKAIHSRDRLRRAKNKLSALSGGRREGTQLNLAANNRLDELEKQVNRTQFDTDASTDDTERTKKSLIVALASLRLQEEGVSGTVCNLLRYLANTLDIQMDWIEQLPIRGDVFNVFSQDVLAPTVSSALEDDLVSSVEQLLAHFAEQKALPMLVDHVPTLRKFLETVHDSPSPLAENVDDILVALDEVKVFSSLSLVLQQGEVRIVDQPNAIEVFASQPSIIPMSLIAVKIISVFAKRVEGLREALDTSCGPRGEEGADEVPQVKEDDSATFPALEDFFEPITETFV